MNLPTIVKYELVASMWSYVWLNKETVIEQWVGQPNLISGFYYYVKSEPEKHSTGCNGRITGYKHALIWVMKKCPKMTKIDFCNFHCNIIKQEVLGRTTRLLSFIRHGPQWKRRVQQFFYCCVFVTAVMLPSNDRGIFTEPLPSNDRVYTHRQQRDLISLLYFFQNKESRLKMAIRRIVVGLCAPNLGTVVIVSHANYFAIANGTIWTLF
jgi:hypothetical protein